MEADSSKPQPDFPKGCPLSFFLPLDGKFALRQLGGREKWRGLEWQETKPGSVGGGCSACVLRCQNSCKAAVGWLWRSHFCKAFPLVAPCPSLLPPPLPPSSHRRCPSLHRLSAVGSSIRRLRSPPIGAWE